MTRESEPTGKRATGGERMRRALFSGLGIAAGALLTVLTLSLFMVKVFYGSREESTPVKVKSDLAAIHLCATYIWAATGKYPASIEEMTRERDDDGKPARVVLGDKPVDPWGRRYIYRLEDGKPVVECLGKDGLPGGIGEDADFIHPAREP